MRLSQLVPHFRSHRGSWKVRPCSPASTGGTSLLSAPIKDADVPFCYRSINAHQQGHALLIILLLTYLTDWTDFSSPKLGLNPNTYSDHVRPWDVSRVSTLILQVCKYAKFSWHLNEKLFPQLAAPRHLNTKQQTRWWGRPRWCICCICNAKKTTSWSPLRLKRFLFFLQITPI